MNPTDGQQAQLEASIAALEAQRSILGDAVVEAAVAALRTQLATIRATGPTADADGERRVVTVMFADVSGFTSLAETMDAEHLRATMNACFSRLTPVIERYGGTIDKFVGDQIMALFGAPVAHEDDADRALHAALDMRVAVEEFNRETGTSLGLHFGINTGFVVAGGVGGADRRDYSVMGDAVNVAARLEALSGDGEILVGPETFRLTSRHFRFVDPRTVALKGKTVPITVRTLAGHSHAAPDDDRAELRAPLVGRAREVALLQQAAGDVGAGMGGVIAIRGDAGVGKSRLVGELRHSLGSKATWAEGRAFSYAKGLGYALTRSLLHSLLRVRPDDPIERIGRELEDSIARTCSSQLIDIYPYLGRLLDLPLHPAFVDALRPLTAEVLQTRTLRAFADYLRARAAASPLVLACEDLHWADPSSLHLLTSVLPIAFEAPLLILLTYRGDDDAAAAFHADSASRLGERYRVLDLQPLNGDDSAALVGLLLGTHDDADPNMAAILDRAEGNPFFLEELLRNLKDAGALVPGAGGGLAVRTADIANLPSTVQGVIMARVDRLPADSKATLQTAAVIGREFHEGVLARVREGEHASAAGFADAVTDLERREFIRAREAADGTDAALEYAFKHAVTQDVAYNSLLVARRRRLHAAIGTAIEALFPTRLDEFAGALAYHFRSARRRSKAVVYLKVAADRAKRSFANAEAIALYRSALEELAAPGGPDGEGGEGGDPAPAPHVVGDIHESLGDVLSLAGSHEDARTAFEQAYDVSADAVVGAARRRKIALSFATQRRFDDSLAASALAEASLDAVPEEARTARWWSEWLEVQLGRMWVYYWQNRTEESNALAESIGPSIEAEGEPALRAQFWVQRALSCLRRDRYVTSDEAMAHAERADAAIRQVENAAALPHLTFVVGFVHLWRGQLDEAAQTLEKSRRLAERVGDAVVHLRCITYLGLIARKRGAVEEARATFVRVRDTAAAAGMPEYVALANAGLAWAAWREGRTDEAERGARQALETWHRMPVPYSFDWMAAWTVVAACLERLDLADAVRHAELMLRPDQQPLPDELARATARAVAAWAARDPSLAETGLRTACAMAAVTGHL